LHLNPDIEARVIDLARSNGVSVEAFQQRVVDEKSPAAVPGGRMKDVFSAVRGLADDVDFSRNTATARNVDR
jgi:hypothetical protein